MTRSEAAALALAVVLTAAPLLRATAARRPPAWADAPRDAVDPVGRLLFGGRLDPNTASEADLTVLPRIGPARAAAITAERAHGPFCGARDLERVPGLGPHTVAGVASWLGFDPERPGCREGLR